MTFEKHLRSVSRSASQKLGIMRRSWRIFGDHSLSLKCFNSFVLPILEYCAPVWRSAAESHLKLLDRVVRGAGFLVGGFEPCDLAHRRSVATLCMLHKVRSNLKHPLHLSLPDDYVAVRATRAALAAHQHTYSIPRCGTVQYSRSFVPSAVSLWNSLDGSVFDGVGLSGFKSRVNSFLLTV
jgi:hypothetical protein